MKDTKQVENLLEQLMKSDLSRPTHCLRALQLVHSLSSPRTLSFLISHLIPHPLTPVGRKACETALQIVRGKRRLRHRGGRGGEGQWRRERRERAVEEGEEERAVEEREGSGGGRGGEGQWRRERAVEVGEEGKDSGGGRGQWRRERAVEEGKGNEEEKKSTGS